LQKETNNGKTTLVDLLEQFLFSRYFS